MEYTIDENGNKRACKLDIPESYDVFVNNGGEFLGTTKTRAEAEKLRDNSKYDNNMIWIWDNITNN